MAISELVNYEQTYTFELMHPKTPEKGLGVHITVKSNQCAAHKKAQAVAMEQNRQLRIKHDNNPPAEAVVELNHDVMYRCLAACISEWDWGEEELFVGEGVPELTPENALRFVKLEWTAIQVMGAQEKIENFTDK